MRQRERIETARSAKGALAAALLLAALCALAALAAPAAAPAAEPEAEPCPNERLREESNLDPNTERPYSIELPDCRAFELVSSPNKNLSVPRPFRFSADGSLGFGSFVGTFAGGSSYFGVGTNYEMSRASTGWLTTPIQPPLSRFSETNTLGGIFSDDAGDSLWLLRPAGAPGGPRTGESDFYRRNPSGEFTEVGPTLPVVPPLNLDPESPGVTVLLKSASADLSHVVFEGEIVFNHQSWPGAVGDPALYEYVGTGNSEPELVDVKNVGTVAAAAASQHKQHLNEAAEPLAACGAQLGGGENHPEGHSENVHNAVSADGETIFFTLRACAGEPPVAELYARLRRAETLPISEPPLQSGCHEGTGCKADATETAEFREANFQGASADGKLAIFLSPQRLLDSATQDPNPDGVFSRENCGQDTEGDSGCNLYAYDLEKPADEALTDLSAGDTSGGGPRVQGVGAVSEDGSHAYFVAKGVLTEAPNEYRRSAQAGDDNLYAYDLRSGHLAFIAVLSPQDEVQWRSGPLSPMQTTPDGRFLLFTSTADPTPDAEGEGRQVYRYDAATGRLSRISVAEGGIDGDGNTGSPATVPTPETLNGANFSPNQDLNPAISDNGSIVVFESPGVLTADATEGGGNLYEYKGGHVHLLAHIAPDQFGVPGGPIGIDHSGRDIFLTDPNPLIPADIDSSIDIYDARVEGGFPAPAEPTVCRGDACQPQEAAPPQAGGPPTFGFSGSEEGPGHPHRPPCPKGRHRKQGKCVKKKTKHRHHMHTKTHGGGK